MKVRRNFVSNSSSSSFVIALEKKPENVEEMVKILFGNDQKYYPLYENGEVPPYTSDEVWNVKQVAEIVFLNIQKQEPIGRDKFDEICCENAEYRYDQLVQSHPNTQIFIVEYGDHSGALYCATEQGALFDRVPHITISHH